MGNRQAIRVTMFEIQTGAEEQNKECTAKPSFTANFGSNAAIVVAPGILLAVPLYFWRIFYPSTDWAALFLAPMTVVLFFGFRKPLAAMLRARFAAMILDDSRISRFMTGRITAVIHSCIFVAVTVPILAWQALSASDLIAFFLVVLCLTASAMALGVRRWLQRHLHDPYSAWHGANLGALIAGMIFIPILAWITWNYVAFPGEFRTLGFWQSVQFGVADQLQQRRGWIAEILALPFAIESAQLWLIARYGTAVWVTVLYSLYLALVAFVVARASTALACFAEDAFASS